MNLVLWIVTTAPLTRSTSGATVPDSAPVPTAPGGARGAGESQRADSARRQRYPR